jgi:hypothetical protein
VREILLDFQFSGQLPQTTFGVFSVFLPNPKECDDVLYNTLYGGTDRPEVFLIY